MGNRVVDEGGPEEGEDNPLKESHPADEGAGDERGRDEGEGHLEDTERERGDGGGVEDPPRAGWGRKVEVTEVDQAAPHEVAPEAALVHGEGKGIAEEDPLYGDNRDANQDAGEDLLEMAFADQRSVEDSQPEGHESDQGGRGENPRCVSAVHIAGGAENG